MPPGSNGVFGIFSNLMQASRWVHASPGFVGFDVGDPARAGPDRVLPRDRGERRLRRRAATSRSSRRSPGSTVDEAVFTGGAAKGTLWPQIVADTLGVPVRIPVVKESTALGAAIYAGVGAGLYDDAATTAAELVRFERTVEPEPGADAAYDDLYEQWLELYRRSLELSEAGLVRPLWRAAGT